MDGDTFLFTAEFSDYIPKETPLAENNPEPHITTIPTDKSMDLEIQYAIPQEAYAILYYAIEESGADGALATALKIAALDGLM